jgi:hypothetical protein
MRFEVCVDTKSNKAFLCCQLCHGVKRNQHFGYCHLIHRDRSDMTACPGHPMKALANTILCGLVLADGSLLSAWPCFPVGVYLVCFNIFSQSAKLD